MKGLIEQARKILMYFSNLQYLYYPQINEERDKFLLTSNIFRRVIFRSDLIENQTNFYEYTLTESDTLESLAEKIYGNPYYYWVILLINNIFNPRFDLPVADDAFSKFIADKYGTPEDAQNISDEYTAAYTSAVNIVTVNTTLPHRLATGRKVYLQFAEGVSINGLYSATVIDPDTFNVDIGEVVSPSTGSVKVSPPYALYYVKDFTTDSFYTTDKETYDLETVDDLKDKRSAYDEEFILNNNNRVIKILQPELLQAFLQEFDNQLKL